MGEATESKLFRSLMALKRLPLTVVAVSLKHLGEESDPRSVDQQGLVYAVGQVIAQSAFPKSAISDDAVRAALEFFDGFQSWETRDEAMIVSLARFVHVYNWNPMDLHLCRSAAVDNASYLCLRNAVGLVTLVWQISKYKDDLALTTEDFARIRGTKKTLPSILRVFCFNRVKRDKSR